MSGFLATQSPPSAAAELTIENDPWFPSIDLAALRKACRIDGSVTPERLREAVLVGLLSVHRELKRYRTQQTAAGIVRLADVPADRLAGDSVQCLHYRRAVYAATQAELTEAYREVETTALRDSRPTGDHPTDRIEDKAAEHRRAMRWAISDLLGIGRSTVELI